MNTVENNSDITFAFFGTPKIATTVLSELEQRRLIPEVIITNPDKPKGRGQEVQPPPTKKWAQERDITVLQPQEIDEAFIKEVADIADFDVLVLVAYGKILPEELIHMPPSGTVNMHPSLLPKERGAAPVRGAILHEDKTGVSIIQLDGELDHGPIIAQEEVVSWSKDAGGPPKAAKLQSKLATAGGELLAEVLPEWVNGEIEAVPQDHEEATYTHKFKKSDAEIDFSDPDYTNFRKIQAFHQWPRPHFFLSDNTRVIINETSFTNNSLQIQNVTPAGEQPMSWETFQSKYELDDFSLKNQS